MICDLCRTAYRSVAGSSSDEGHPSPVYLPSRYSKLKLSDQTDSHPGPLTRSRSKVDPFAMEDQRPLQTAAKTKKRVRFAIDDETEQPGGDSRGFQIAEYNAESLLLRMRQEATEPATVISADNTPPKKVVIFGTGGSGKTALLNSLLQEFGGNYQTVESPMLEASEQTHSAALIVAGRRVEIVEPAVGEQRLTAEDFVRARQNCEQLSAPTSKRTTQQQYAAEIYRYLADADRILICCSLRRCRFDADDVNLQDKLMVCLYSGAAGLRENLKKVRFVMTFRCYCNPDRSSKMSKEEYVRVRTKNWLAAINSPRFGAGRYGLKFDDSCISTPYTHHDRPCRPQEGGLSQLMVGIGLEERF